MTGSMATLGGEGGSSFPFDVKGDTVRGKVRGVEKRQQTVMDGPDKGKPAFWPDGKEKWMYTVTLQTDLRDDDDDDGVRTVHLKGALDPSKRSSLGVTRAAVKAATGSYDMQYDADYALQFTDEEPPTQRGLSGRKLWSAWYTPPAMTLGGEPTPTAGVATPTPTPAPAAAPTPTTSAPSAPSAPGASAPAGITPEQLAAMQAMSAPAPAWDSDPRVAQLRAMGIADEAIRQTLNI